MRRASCWTALAVIVLLAVPAPLSAKGSEGLERRTVQHGELEREYHEYVPPRLADEPALVLALHGGGIRDGAALAQPKDPFSHLMTLADRDGFVAVYPSGVGNSWNDCRSDSVSASDADDVGFLSHLIDEMVERHDVDPSRVYAVGISNGGMMAYRLAFELSERIAAVGAVVANLPVDPAGVCREPTSPVGVFVMNGDRDPLMPWDGGCVQPEDPSCERGSVLSTQDTIAYWVAHNQAAETPSAFVYPEREERARDTRVVRYDHGGETAVALFHVEGGGHLAPSTQHHYSPVSAAALGPQNRDIEAMAELWELLRRHRRHEALLGAAEPEDSGGSEQESPTAAGSPDQGQPTGSSPGAGRRLRVGALGVLAALGALAALAAALAAGMAARRRSR